MPQEIILPKGKLSSTTSKVLRASLRNPRQHQLAPGDSFWDAASTLQEIEQAGYFKASQGQQGALPPALQVMLLLFFHSSFCSGCMVRLMVGTMACPDIKCVLSKLYTH